MGCTLSISNEIMVWLVSTHRFDPGSVDRVVWVKVPQEIRELIPRISNLVGIWQHTERIHLIPPRVWQIQSQLKRLPQEPYPNWSHLQPDKNDCAKAFKVRRGIRI